MTPVPGTERPAGDSAYEWLERLTGAHSTKPGFYGSWRRSAAGLERTISALREVSTALCAAKSGVEELSSAVVQAASRYFDARCVAIVPSPDGEDHPSMQASLLIDGLEVRHPASLPKSAAALCGASFDSGTTVVSDGDPGDIFPFQLGDNPRPCTGIAMPVPVDGLHRASLVVLLPGETNIDDTDISILQILVEQTAATLRNVMLFRDSESLRAQAVYGWAEASRKARELERRNEELLATQLQLSLERQQRSLEAERARIATELHDNVVQYLVSIGMNLEWCRRRVEGDELLLERLESIHDMSRVGLARVRDAIVELSCLGSGLAPALENLTHVLKAQARMVVRITGDTGRLSVTEEHSIFHFVQEAAFNAVRHGNARRLWVNIAVSAEAFRVSIADDSTSDPGNLELMLDLGKQGSAVPGRRGIDTMRERIAELSARFEVSPRRGGGVRLVIEGKLKDGHG